MAGGPLGEKRKVLRKAGSRLIALINGGNNGASTGVVYVALELQNYAHTLMMDDKDLCVIEQEQERREHSFTIRSLHLALMYINSCK